MECEIVDEIPECSTASLHVSETEDVLNEKDELLTGNKFEKRTQSTSVEVVDVAGQVVPFHTCTNPEREAKENSEHLAVPLVKLNSLEESDKFIPDAKGFGLFTTSTGLEQENTTKTFLWPPIGLKDGVVTDQSAANTFEKFVSHEDEEEIDNGITIAEPEQVIKDHVSNHTNQSEKHGFREDHNLTSILKKDDSRVKKTVHFPENIVSVKFYDLSDDEDSDNDTVILSDPEEDDSRDQEVPFNTYNDYSTDCYLLSPTSLSFIPNFTFPPQLKINNCQLYEDIDDDDDEQILAIMDDDDGRKLSDTDTLVADEIHSEENMNGYGNDNLISTEMDKIPNHVNKDIEEKTKMTSKEMARLVKCEGKSETEYQSLQQASIDSENPEETRKIMDVRLSAPKNETELVEDDLKIKFDGTDEYCEVQVTAREVKKLPEISTEVFEAQKVLKFNGLEPLVGSHEESVNDSQMAPIEMQSQSKFQEVSLSKRGSRDEYSEENFDKNMNEVLQRKNDDMAGKGTVSTLMQKFEIPVRVRDSKASAGSQRNVKLPHIHTLLDVLKANSSISGVKVEERCHETAEELDPFENNLIEQEATCSHNVKRNALLLTTMLPEISVFNLQQSEKVDKELNVAQRPGMMQMRSVGNETVLECEEPCIDKQAIYDNYPNVTGANSVQLFMKNTTALTQDVSKLSTESVIQNVELPAKHKTKPSPEIVIRIDEFAAEDKPKPDLVTNGGSFKESNDSSDGHVDVSLLTSGCTRTFHRNYGSKFLWRGPRSISTLILDEDFHVQTASTADNDTSHQCPLTKEEITFPNFTIMDYRSLESMIPAAEWSGSQYCYEESQLEKYPHSFVTSPDHVNEIEETRQSTIERDLSIRRQKVETYDYNAWLKQDCLKSEIGQSVEHSKTEFEYQRNRPYSATTFKHVNPSDAPESSEECVTPHTQPDHAYCPGSQIVPDMYVPCLLKTQPTRDSPRAVPSDDDNLIMNTTNASLHLTEYPRQSKFGTVKEESNVEGSSYSTTPILARQGRRRLRVGLSKSTRVKPLHPYWSRERIKEKGSMS